MSDFYQLFYRHPSKLFSRCADMSAKLVGLLGPKEGVHPLSTGAIGSTLLSQIANSPAASSQFVADLNKLAQDLQDGNVFAAEQDYVTLANDAENSTMTAEATPSASATADSAAGTSASGITTSMLSQVASSPSSADTFASQINQLGADLQNGDLTSAQEDMLGIDSTVLNAASSANAASSTTASANTGTAGTTSQANQAEIPLLVHAVVQAMETGDSSVINTTMLQLASVSSSSQGASILQQEAGNLASGAASSASSSSSSVSQLLQSFEPDGSNTSTLSQLA
jgi:hypothetical protein